MKLFKTVNKPKKKTNNLTLNYFLKLFLSPLPKYNLNIFLIYITPSFLNLKNLAVDLSLFPKHNTLET